MLALAQTHGLPRSRVDELIELVGLESVAGKRVGGFSLGMGQRLGIAAALLGDPETIMLDEPTNGLDPDGVRWIRELLKGLAAEGRTVFLSSHLMSELSQTADHVIVIGRGRVIADIGITELLAQASANADVIVRSPDAARLRELLAGPGVATRSNERNVLEVHGATSAQIGDLAAAYGLVLHELIPQTASLEEAYMKLTNDSREYIAEREVQRPDLEIAA